MEPTTYSVLIDASLDLFDVRPINSTTRNNISYHDINATFEWTVLARRIDNVRSRNLQDKRASCASGRRLQDSTRNNNPEDVFSLNRLWERTMNSETVIGKIKARFNDWLGLPPGDKTPDGKGIPPKSYTVPKGGLTSPEAKGLNPHAGTGLKVER
jgi:hypothetical protein